MCTGQLSNFVCYLHRNHPELHGPSAPGPSELDQPSGTLQNLTLGDLIRHLHRKVLLSAPEPSSISSAIYASGTLRVSAPEPSGTLWNPSAHQPSAPELSRTSSAFCPEPSAPEPFGTLSAICTRTLRNFISLLLRNPPEPYQPSAPEPSKTLSAICTGTLRNFISQLPRNCPEPHQPSAPEPSGTSSAICTGRLRNPPEPSPEPGVAAAPDRTRAFLG